MEYKIGDKVEIIGNLDETDIENGFKVGQVLTVSSIYESDNVLFFEEEECHGCGLFPNTVQMYDQSDEGTRRRKFSGTLIPLFPFLSS